MDTLREFVDKGCRNERSVFRKVAREFWGWVARKAANGVYETEVLAPLYKCTGCLNMREALAQWMGVEGFREMLSVLVKTILEHAQRLESGVAWQRVLAATEDELKEKSRDFAKECLELFKNICIDTWRNTPGTFAYYYRDAQNKLREHIGEIRWSLYDPHSRYYGPGGLEDPMAINIEDEQFLNSIPLPKEMLPAAEKRFSVQLLLAHARWFHEHIDQSREAAVAIKNLVMWLCLRYPLLVVEIRGMTAEDLGAAGGVYEPACENDELNMLAKKAAALLDDREKKILLMLIQRIPYEKIAAELGLSGPSHVNYYKKNIQRILRDIRFESPAMCGAVDEESMFEYNNPDGAGQVFTQTLLKLCR